MSKDAKPQGKAKDLKIVGKVRVIDRNPRAKELHDGQVKVLARLIRRIALEKRKGKVAGSIKQESRGKSQIQSGPLQIRPTSAAIRTCDEAQKALSQAKREPAKSIAGAGLLQMSATTYRLFSSQILAR